MWVTNYNTGTDLNRMTATTLVNDTVAVGATQNDVVFDATIIWVTLPVPN